MPVAPPPPRLPPLSHLAAFSQTLRAGGYAAAAQGVTPGAMRARVRALEAALGTALFDSQPHGIRPTARGLALGDALAPVWDALARALQPWGAGPPLDALPAVEAALRHDSFTAAAAERGISPGAIAAQIRRFEAWAARPLFQRHARGVSATPPARALHPGLSRALTSAAVAVADPATALVRIAALPSVAQLWLAPRLPALRAALPGIAVSLTALERAPQAKRAPYDLALFFAERGGRLLAEDALVPVCAPCLAAQVLAAPALAALPCLSDSAWAEDWRHWMQAARPGQTVPRGVEHSLYALALDEALAGAGVLIGHTALLGRALANGTLVAPLGPRLPLARGLRMQPLRPLARGGAAMRVADWLAGPGARLFGAGRQD